MDLLRLSLDKTMWRDMDQDPGTLQRTSVGAVCTCTLFTHMVGFVSHHWQQSAGYPRKGLLKYVQSLLHAVIQDSMGSYWDLLGTWVSNGKHV